MKLIGYFVCVILFGLASAGYRYSNPLLPALQPIRQNYAQVQSNSGIYSVLPSPPLAQFNIQGAGSLQLQQQQPQLLQQQQTYVAPLPLPAPAPQHQVNYAPAVQQNYLPPLQQQQQQYVSQPIQQQSIQQNSIQQQSIQQQPILQPIPQRQQNLIQQTFAGLGQNYQSNQQLNQNQHQHQHHQQQQVIVTKDIFIHSAPEDHEDIQLGQQIDNSVPIRKNYRIVFIKAPSHSLRYTAAALKAQAPLSEEKTVIYVLSKRPDITEVQQQIQQVQSEQKAHKPEVYFIKYKTQEEAQRAQQEIQAQYDALGGSTHISDEGVAPIRSVIGGGSVGVGASGGGGSIVNNGFSSSSNSGSFGSASQQTFTQTSLDQSGSSNSLTSTPSQKYLPSKTKV